MDSRLHFIKCREFCKKITDAKLHVPIVTLCSKDNVNLTKQLSDGFKRSVYWRNYQTIPAKVKEKGNKIYELLSALFEGVKRLSALAYVIEADIKDNKKYFLPRGEIEYYNVLIDETTFYGQPINSLIKQYDGVKKLSTEHGDDYTTGCLLDYVCFKDNYRSIAVDLTKQKPLNADSRTTQQIVFQGVAGGANNTNIRLYTIFEKSKETGLEFYKGTTKVL